MLDVAWCIVQRALVRVLLSKPLLVCRCGHCKHLTPEYKKLGAEIAADPKLSSRVVIAKARRCCCCLQTSPLLLCKNLRTAEL